MGFASEVRIVMHGLETMQSRTVARAATSTYVVFGIMLAVPDLLFTAAFFQLRGAKDSWMTFLLAVSMTALTLAWIRAFRIEFGDGRIAYRNLFQGTREIGLHEISMSAFRVGHDEKTGRSSPFIRLELILKDGAQWNVIGINTKVLRREDIRKIVEYLDSAGVGPR